MVKNISSPKDKRKLSQNFQGREKKVETTEISGFKIAELKGVFASSTNFA